jgi:hypothetical protein
MLFTVNLFTGVTQNFQKKTSKKFEEFLPKKLGGQNKKTKGMYFILLQPNCFKKQCFSSSFLPT